jgi:uncharacterized protein with FMN-binding domain
MKGVLNMMKKNSGISRRDFLKGATAGAITFAASGMLGGFAHAAENSADTVYTPGTYTAKAKGIGDVTVTMTFDETSITDVIVDVSNETETIGQLHGETLKEALLQAQSADIDAVSGATVTSDAVKEAAANCIAQAMGVAVPSDETADASASGKSWRDAPDPVDESQIKETYDTDVVVVGHGYAGLNACRYLASQGIAVTLIESQAEDKYMAMGNEAGVPNASALLERGVPEIDPIEYYNNWMLNSNYQANPALMMKFCQNSGAAMDEYLSVLSEDDLSNMTTAFYPPTEHQMSQIGAYKFWPSTCSFYSQ